MKHAEPRRPSHISTHPNGLWSLWDMLDLYGYSLVTLMQTLRRAEEELAHDVEANPQAIWPHTILETSLSLTLNIAGSLADQLQLSAASNEVKRLTVQCKYNALKSDILTRLRELQIRIQEDLRTKNFLYVHDDVASFWEKPHLFGESVSKKFAKAKNDIQSAGNCLAVLQPVACVFHLMRAMEVAVRVLSKRLHITITPQTTWRSMTGNMDGKIKSLPDKTNRQKGKKNDWEAASVNLHHVGSVWRNNTMHPASSYTQAQAKDVFNATRVFMVSLSEL